MRSDFRFLKCLLHGANALFSLGKALLAASLTWRSRSRGPGREVRRRNIRRLLPSDRLLALLDERQAARQAKNFARADAIRQELKSKGWQIEDTPKGARLKRS